ncbi:MAG: hypothetical protein WD605_02150 [Candidatus Paceibacterota bacterium]
MTKQKRNTGRPSIPFAETKRTPDRVASRLEGVVKNAGIKEKKKEPKGK